MTPSWFLWLSAAAAVSAVAALGRASPSSYWGLGCFALGFPAFHFTNVVLLAGAATTALAACFGALDSTSGKLGMAMAVVAFAALLVVRRRSLKVGAAARRALEDGLGPQYRELIPRARAESARYRSDSSLWSSPWKLRLRGVERIANLSYGDAGERNLLDLYRLPAAAGETRLPILLWIHGGAWTLGHKSQQGLPLLYRMARRGWISVAINYRLGPASRLPDPLVDVKRAIAWIRTNAAQYGGDPQCIVACGGSAGGHLLSLAALTANNPAYQPGFETVDTTLAGAIPLYGRFDFIDRSGVLPDKRALINFLTNKVMPCRLEDDPAAWDRASPIAQVGSHAPPMFVMHGTHDSVIPLAEAEAFVTALRSRSAQPVVFARFDGAQHAWDLFNTPWTEHTVNAVHSFCEYAYAQHMSRRMSNP